MRTIVLGGLFTSLTIAGAFGAAVWERTARAPNTQPQASDVRNANVGAGTAGSVTATDMLDMRGPEQQPGLLDHVRLAHREADPAWRSATEFRLANRHFGFAFDLPADISVEKSDDRWADFGQETAHVTAEVNSLTRFDPAFDVERELGGRDPVDPFRSFAIATAQLHCVADGPDGGTMCDRVRDVTELRSKPGLRVLQIRLILTEFAYGKRRIRRLREHTLAPMYAVDVSRQGRLNVLLLSTSVHEPRTIAQTQLAERIARSVELTRECEVADEDAHVRLR